MSRSSRAVLDKHLQAIQDDVLRMAHLLDAAISRSLEALAAQDARLAQEIVAGDAQINALRFGIEEACLALIATQQPAAGDLRAVIAAMNIVGDMERMADHAAGVARLVQTMGGEPLLKPLIDIPRMVEVCRSMLRESLQAFVERNPDKARQVAIQDNTIDALYKQIFCCRSWSRILPPPRAPWSCSSPPTTTSASAIGRPTSPSASSSWPAGRCASSTPSRPALRTCDTCRRGGQTPS
jgi:phosphate transport system protein